MVGLSMLLIATTLEGPFPEAADFMGDDSDSWAAGTTGHVTGDVRNASLQVALGKDTAEINYDLIFGHPLKQPTKQKYRLTARLLGWIWRARIFRSHT